MQKFDVEVIKKEANGRWPSIFNMLGVDVVNDPKKHSACPICGPGNNSHRFRFDNKEGRGTWICTSCGSGDGIGLVQGSLGISFSEALERISKIVLTAELSSVPSGSIDVAKRRKLMNDIWTGGKAVSGHDLVSKYLMSRRIYKTPKDVRFNEHCYCVEVKKEVPAMIAMFRNEHGEAVAIQRTYLVPNLRSKKMSLSIPEARMAGGAVRLMDPTGVLGIAEGIETALSASQLFNIPVWATLSNTLLERWVPPEKIRKIVVFGDNDHNFCGQGSAYKLANRLYNDDRIVDVCIPDLNDWNDMLKHYGERLS